ncbi:MAG: methyl-accepting chemotaxis protein, partial [Gemmatimonadales bacterium]
EFERTASERLSAIARRAAVSASAYVAERQRDMRLVGTVPALAASVQLASRRHAAAGLDRRPTADIERTAGSGLLQPDTSAQRILAAFARESDIDAFLLTDRHGFTVAATGTPGDRVQSDEPWWQRTIADGSHLGPAEASEAERGVALVLGERIDVAGEPAGVLRGTITSSRFARYLSLERSSVTIELLDADRRILVTGDTAALLRVADGAAAILLGDGPMVTRLRTATGEDHLVVTAPTVGGRWWVAAREPRAVGLVGAVPLKRALYSGAGVVLAVVLSLVLWITYWLNTHVTRPIRSAGAVTRRVAEGDLTTFADAAAVGTEEVTDLLKSVGAMVQALRELVGQIRTAAEEAAALAQEISASTEEMSASTEEMAGTCQDLTGQATSQAGMVKGAAADADRILGITTSLADGANMAAERNAALAESADRHREELLVGVNQLKRLAADLEEGVAEARQLAAMSEEIELFVRQARAIASQTNMLALNAAIEASRAGGGEGRGFTVVADEVRKLASQAAGAAASTSQTVETVLTTLTATRERLTRLGDESAHVRRIAEATAAGLEEVTGSAAETSAWTGEISGAANEVRQLVEEITKRLQTISQATESVVAAAEQIAASAQEQSASTEEIAGSASHLAEAAERLTGAIQSFRTDGGGMREVQS